MSLTRTLFTDLSLLLLRVALGVTFVIHGFGKFGGDAGLTGFASYLDGHGVPLPHLSAWLAALAELGGGAFLVVGLLPRVAAAGIAFTMFVAIAKVHWGNGFQLNPEGPDGWEYCFNLLVMAIVIMLLGGGRFGLQKLVVSKLFRKSEGAGAVRAAAAAVTPKTSGGSGREESPSP